MAPLWDTVRINGMRGLLRGGRRSAVSLVVAPGIFLLSVLALAMSHVMLIIPPFAPVVASTSFRFFYEIHDLLALGIILVAAYKYSAPLGLAATLVFLVPHVLYSFVQSPEDAPQLVRILTGTLVALVGIWLINRLHQAETLSRRAEEEQRVLEKRYRTTLDSMLEGCQIIGFDWRYLYINDSAARHGRHAKEELLGNTMMEMYPGIEDTEMGKHLRRCMEQRVTHYMENLFTYPDGSQRCFELGIQPVPEGTFILSLDITERKQAEETRDRLLRELQAKVEEIQALSYGIAHDLRGPLVSIQNFIGMLGENLKKQETGEAEQDLKAIKSSASKMEQRIKEILDHMRAGQVIRRDENVPFREIVQEALDQIAGQIISSDASISLPERFPTITVDRMRMTDVLSNLIQNSIVFRDKSRRLTIEIGHHSSGSEEIFFVRDNGIGITPDKLEKIFEAFYRGTKESQGTGLGLAIARRVVEAHGGKIWAESEAGKGTTIYFRLPAGKGKGEAPGAMRPERVPLKRNKGRGGSEQVPQ